MPAQRWAQHRLSQTVTGRGRAVVGDQRQWSVARREGWMVELLMLRGVRVAIWSTGVRWGRTRGLWRFGGR